MSLGRDRKTFVAVDGTRRRISSRPNLASGFVAVIISIAIVSGLWAFAWGAFYIHARRDLAANGTQIVGTVETWDEVGSRDGSALWGEVLYVEPGQTAPQIARLWLAGAGNTPGPAIGSSITLVYEKGNSRSPDTLADLQQNLGLDSILYYIFAIVFLGALGTFVHIAIKAYKNRPIGPSGGDPGTSPPQTMPPLSSPSNLEDYWNSVDKQG